MGDKDPMHVAAIPSRQIRQQYRAGTDLVLAIGRVRFMTLIGYSSSTSMPLAASWYTERAFCASPAKVEATMASAACSASDAG